MNIVEMIKNEPYKSCYEHGYYEGMADGRADAFKECISIIDNIMPAMPFITKSKHYENWKMKTAELRMLRDMLEQLQKMAE